MELDQFQTSSEPYTKLLGIFKMVNLGLSSKTYGDSSASNLRWTLYETSGHFQNDEFRALV